MSSEDLGFSLGEATRVTYFTIKQVKCVLLTTGLQIYEFSSEEHNFEKLIWRGFGQPVTYGPAASL